MDKGKKRVEVDGPAGGGRAVNDLITSLSVR